MQPIFYRTSGHHGGSVGYRYTCWKSDDIYSHLPDSARNHCNTYAAAGVVCSKNIDVHIHAAHGRLTSYDPHGANKAFLFG